QNDIRLLGFVNEAWCKRLVGDDLPIEELIRHPAVHEKISAGLAVHNKAHPNVSARVARVLLQATAPLADNGEITEKGYINQSRTQALRQDQVDILYKDTGDLPDNLLIL
ncbi:MAG TPA: hypothetical protein DDY28_04685, partial [Hyphomonas atlantica]|nr:hypothetical protein [Hyphomonas atlantica]